MLIPVKGMLLEGRIGESEDFRQDEKRPVNISIQLKRSIFPGNDIFFIIKGGLIVV